MLQKVNWVCEDELSTGPVEFEGPVGYSGWDEAEAPRRGPGWRPGVETLSVQIGAGAKRT